MSEILFIILAFLLLILSFIKNKFTYILVCSLLFVLSAFRGFEVGTDTINYYQHFISVQNEISLTTEPLWNFLLWGINFLGGDFRTVMIVSSILILLPVFTVVYRDSRNPIFSIFLFYTLYFYFYSFNITRQFIGISLVFAGISFLLKSKNALFILFVMVAGLFHFSSFIALILLFLKYIPQNRIFITVGVLIAFILGVFFNGYFFNLASSFFHYDVYSNIELGSLFGNAMYILILNVFFFFIMFSNKENDGSFLLLFLYILLANLFARIPIIGYRVTMFFGLIQITYFANIVYNNKIKEKIIMPLIIVIFAFTMFYYRFGEGGIFPYTIDLNF